MSAPRVADRQKPVPGGLALDHLGHFVPDLEAAARLLEALGFTVTPVSHHRIAGQPAGTANRCVMLEQGYLEILAPTLDTPHAQRVRAHMARYDGVHLACFGTPDAQFEHGRLAAHGFEPEPLVELRRPLDTGELARFKVVYSPADKMPEGRVQYCEHLTPQHLWKDGLVNAFALRDLYVLAEDPAAAAARWARFCGLLPRPDGDLVYLQAARGRVVIGSTSALSQIVEDLPPAPALAAYRLACSHPEAFVARCSGLGLAVRKTAAGHAVSLPPSLGGVWLV
ncbi:MAG: VOC family protein [Burkholderiales bacterium]